MLTRPTTVLVTEDEALLGLDLEDILSKAGFAVVGPATTVAESVFLLERHSPELALIDGVLRDGSSASLAWQLEERRIPFVVHSGLPQDEAVRSRFPETVWLTKPASPEEVLDALDLISVRAQP